MIDVRLGRPAARRRDQSGQTLVEFALVIPILMLLVMGIFEFAVAFNAFVGLNRASQNAAHLAATLGDLAGGDCLILQGIESDVQAPNDRARIQQVEIQRTPMAGNRAIQAVVYDRTESLRQCELPNGTMTSVPYKEATNRPDLEALGRAAYTEGERCAVLDGCNPPSVVMPRTSVDNIGVAVRYRHDWVTPLSSIITALPGGTSGWTFTQRNIFRMEPVF